MKKLMTLFAFIAFGTVASYAGELEFTTSCGDTYIIQYPDGMETSELFRRLLLLDEALC